MTEASSPAEGARPCTETAVTGAARAKGTVRRRRAIVKTRSRPPLGRVMGGVFAIVAPVAILTTLIANGPDGQGGNGGGYSPPAGLQAGGGRSASTLPPSAIALVDEASITQIGTGPGGFTVSRGVGVGPASGMTCFVSFGESFGAPMSGTDCDTPDAFERRGVSVAGTRTPSGRFVGYAVIASDLDHVRLGGAVLPLMNGIVFFDVVESTKQLRASGGSRSAQALITARPLPPGPVAPGRTALRGARSSRTTP